VEGIAVSPQHKHREDRKPFEEGHYRVQQHRHHPTLYQIQQGHLEQIKEGLASSHQNHLVPAYGYGSKNKKGTHKLDNDENAPFWVGEGCEHRGCSRRRG